MAERFTSLDGLFSSTDPDAVATWDEGVLRDEFAAADWVDRLRALGVKFAAPDDGWVRRRPDGTGSASVSWYPLFDDGAEAGDLIAFGRPPDGAYGVDHYVPSGDHAKRHAGDFTVPAGEVESACQGYRLARVTRAERRSGILGRHVTYHYEDTGVRVPPVPESRRFWLRRWVGGK